MPTIEGGIKFEKDQDGNRIIPDAIKPHLPELLQKLGGGKVVPKPKPAPKPEVKPDVEPKEEDKEALVSDKGGEKLSEKEAYDLNKKEQLELLKKLGVSADQLKELNKEKLRVNKILELQG